MTAVETDGWVVVPCNAPDLTLVEIALGTARDFRPAFRDYAIDGSRVAKIRVPEDVTGRVRVYVRIDGRQTEAGVVAV